MAKAGMFCMKWVFLVFLLCFSFVSADLLTIGTGGDEIMLGYGNQIDLFFSGTNSNPVVVKLSPISSLVTTDLTQTYIYNVSDTENIENCSLLIGGLIIQTDTSINKSENNSFTYTHTAGTFNWSIQCTDEYSNTGTTDNFTIQFYIDYGGGGGSPYNYYSQCYNISDGQCKYTAFYDQHCPDNYFLTLDACQESLLISKINQTTFDKIIKWSNTLFTENKTSFPLNETKTEIINIINKIPSDINRYFSTIALKITPSSEIRGKCIIIIFLILLMFYRKIVELINDIKIRKW